MVLIKVIVVIAALIVDVIIIIVIATKACIPLEVKRNRYCWRTHMLFGVRLVGMYLLLPSGLALATWM